MPIRRIWKFLTRNSLPRITPKPITQRARIAENELLKNDFATNVLFTPKEKTWAAKMLGLQVKEVEKFSVKRVSSAENNYAVIVNSPQGQTAVLIDPKSPEHKAIDRIWNGLKK